MREADVRTNQIQDYIMNDAFSGVVYAKDDEEVLLQLAAGYANRAEEIENNIYTSFAIASGCKLFTAVAICQLVERGLLTFHTKVNECFKVPLPNVDDGVTIHHLLTHTSGVHDYFDEDVMDDFEDLWKETPMYTLNEPKDYLPLFESGQMKFNPGQTFHYNNAAFIILGLVIEELTEDSFTDYIATNIFARCGMHDSGYFSLDALPKNTAIGYIDFDDGGWKTNIYSTPKVGGPDGGAYITAPDMIKFWEGLINGKVCSKAIIHNILTPHVHVKDNTYYGYGVWMEKREGEVVKYHVMGYDPGVSFHSAYYPNSDVKVVIPSNKEKGPFRLMRALEQEWELF